MEKMNEIFRTVGFFLASAVLVSALAGCGKASDGTKTRRGSLSTMKQKN